MGHVLPSLDSSTGALTRRRHRCWTVGRGPESTAVALTFLAGSTLVSYGIRLRPGEEAQGLSFLLEFC